MAGSRFQARADLRENMRLLCVDTGELRPPTSDVHLEAARKQRH